MATQRFNQSDQIINADLNSSTNNTQRVDGTIIDSDILSTSVPMTAVISADINLSGNGVMSDLVNLGDVSVDIIRLIVKSGEAEVYLVRYNNEQAVLKYYYTTFSPKQDIINKLILFKRIDIVRILKFGTYQNRCYEISEYMTGGTLNVILPLVDLNQLKKIISQIVDALHYCHQNGIIHRDIKPDNIFFRSSERTQIALGDFGISSSLLEGQDLRKTTIARTSIFAAPELFNNIANKTILGKKVDYYALGISIIELWSGKEPFDKLGDYGLSYAKLNGRVPIPQDLPQEWQQLIKGLITVAEMDRWGYEEFVAWSSGKPVKLAYIQNIDGYGRFEFDKAKALFVNSPQEMVKMIKEYPKKATVHLYSHAIARWVELVSQDTYTQLYNIVEKEYPHAQQAGLTKAAYLLDTERPYETADGTLLHSQTEMAIQFENNQVDYQSELTKDHHSFYLFLEARGFTEQANEFRARFKKLPAKRALNSIIIDLQGAEAIYIGNHVFHQVDELMGVDDTFREQWIVPALVDPDSKLSIWLSNDSDRSNRLAKWRQTGHTDETSINYALGTWGFRLNGEEAFTVDDFKGLIKRQANRFLEPSGGPALIKKADQWLRTYKEDNLPSIAADLLPQINNTPDEFLAWCHYLFDEWGDPYSRYKLIQKIIRPAQQVLGTEADDWEQLAKICLPSIQLLIWNVNKQGKTGLLSLDNAIGWIRTLSSDQPLFEKNIIYLLDSTIDQLVYSDLQQTRSNNKQFHQLMSEIDDFIKKNIGANHAEIPFVKVWLLRKRILRRKAFEIQTVHDTSRQNDLNTLHKQFMKLLQNSGEDWGMGLAFWTIFFTISTLSYIPLLISYTDYSLIVAITLVVIGSMTIMGLFLFVEWPVSLIGKFINWVFYQMMPEEEAIKLITGFYRNKAVSTAYRLSLRSSSTTFRSIGKAFSAWAHVSTTDNINQLIESVNKKYDAQITAQTKQETMRVFLMPQASLAQEAR